ncbi:sigma factor-like helix-turn-helix DNA-binding protein [Pseudomonas putida]|uniref:sigma factor-like helix-turn-helix DNA-binding protein n=1 Tax=Pseudomonas putida TaxID=303 RepID=UPI000A109823|nr:sigma factor-like helix-turn-helix DNA-binding protein [Pseudomonas putida]ORL47837.1 RNA polymerase subunit sigma [Pseudomonas putida]
MPSNDSVQTLYSDHHGWLHAWLRSKLGNAADAADLAHDTFVRLLQRREELHRAYMEALAHVPEAQYPSAETRELLLELLERIARMLDGLKPKVRRAFLLAQCEGLKHQAIAEQMGISVRTVERYIADALFHCYVLRYDDEC